MNVPEGGYSDEMRFLDLSDDAVIEWGRLFSAEVVIHGQCEIIEGKEISVSLKALDIEEGRIICKDTVVESLKEGGNGKEHIIKGIEKAISNIAVRVSPEIILALETHGGNIIEINVTLKGLRSFKQFREFRDFLKRDIFGVGLVLQTRVKGNAISVSVAFSGDQETFMEKVFKHKNFPFPADVTKTEKGEIIIDIRSDQDING